MLVTAPINTIDYLVIGHLTCDITPEGCNLGGTAAYAALTARALGLRPGIVTSCSQDLPLEPLFNIPIVNLVSEQSTTFRNITTPEGRIQYISAQAETLAYHHIPETWRTTPIIHLAPVAQEVEPGIIRSLSSPLIGITPQGWMRSWDESGRVFYSEWIEAAFVLRQSAATILSIKDVSENETILDEFAASCPIISVTEAAEGSRVYWNGDIRRFRPPLIEEIDSVGSGDIYAAAFLARLFTTRDPWEAARFATHLAAYSVTRRGLAGIPTQDEIHTCLVEVF
jgi:sugar/nucleoside kinase (ribokinase family)